MEFFALLGVLLVIGSVFGWVSFFKVRNLEAHLKQLKSEIELLRRSIVNSNKSSPQSLQEKPPEITQSVIPEALDPDEESSIEIPESKHEITADDTDTDDAAAKPSPEPDSPEADKPPRKPLFDPIALFEQFKDNWMLWVGGLSVALAAVFLARYAIQYGVLGPVGRIIAGIVTGLALHISAEYLRRKLANNHPSFAMLAAGGSIGLFATLLAALHYYQMFSPTLVFFVLAVVAVITMWLSLIHGPILAAMGMVGAYVLPILVSTGSGNVLVALAYSLIITISILLLLQYVKRGWLWYGMVAGSLFWWAVSLDSSSADHWRLWYLAVLGYVFLSVMQKDWFLQHTLAFQNGDRFYNLLSNKISEPERWTVTALLGVVFALIVSVISEGIDAALLPAWLPLSLLILYAARLQAYLIVHSWLSLFGILGGLIIVQVDTGLATQIKPLELQQQPDFLHNMLLFVVVFSGMAFINERTAVLKVAWTAMTLMTPILVLVAVYLLMPAYLEQTIWALTGVLVGALYLFLATSAKAKGWSRDWQAWLYLSGHFAYSFAAVTYFNNGTLTLAIAIQAVSLVMIINRYQLTELDWLVKVITAVTVLRLSANPWLMDYATTSHWTIWTYGGSFLAIASAAYLLRENQRLSRWLEGAALHLLVLTIWVELRYYLYDGVVFQSDYTFTEAALNVMIFGSLALIYYYRSSLSQTSQKIYQYYSYILMLAAISIYAIILTQTLDNDYSVWSEIGTTPIWNIILLAYGFPVVLFALAMHFYYPRLKVYFEYLTGLAAFIFINLEIRHLWQGTLNLNLPTSDGEFYTYSIVWLLAAIAMIILGSYRLGRRYYKVGMAMLVLVVLKVFIFDMSQLDGVYRIIAFMGLGLSLLGMAYIHKKLEVILDAREAAVIAQEK